MRQNDVVAHPIVIVRMRDLAHRARSCVAKDPRPHPVMPGVNRHVALPTPIRDCRMRAG